MGVSVVNALSIDLKASVHKDGKLYVQEYKQGKEQYLVKEDGTTDRRGTEVIFYPDPTIFESLEYTMKFLLHECVNFLF